MSVQNSRHPLTLEPRRDPLSTRTRGALATTALTLALAACGAFPRAAYSYYSAAPFQAGEVLTYKVKWGLIRLGTVRISQELPDSSGNARCTLTLSGKSADGLPFIHAFFVDHSLLDPHNPTTWRFTSEDGNVPIGRTVYRGDSSASEVSYVESVGNRVEKSGNVSHIGSLYDVLGLFMLIRGMNGSSGEVVIPTLMEKQVKETRLKFSTELQQEKSDAFPGRVQVRHFVGKGTWTCHSCAGMTGGFQGSVTADSAAIPVQFSMKIALGSVVLKLESCSRAGQPGPMARPGEAGILPQNSEDR